MKTGTFDSLKRAKEKQQSRNEDQRRIDSGEITREDLWKENSFFWDFFDEIRGAPIINRRKRNGVNKIS